MSPDKCINTLIQTDHLPTAQESSLLCFSIFNSHPSVRDPLPISITIDSFYQFLNFIWVESYSKYFLRLASFLLNIMFLRSMHIVCLRSSSFFITGSYSIVWMRPTLFLCSPIEGLLNCFPFLRTINKTALSPHCCARILVSSLSVGWIHA